MGQTLMSELEKKRMRKIQRRREVFGNREGAERKGKGMSAM